MENSKLIEFLIRHGYALLGVAVLAEQLGLPIPAAPILLGMGALSGQGLFSFPITLAVAVAAAVIADYVWFQLGRWQGVRVLRLLCKISLEPDSCVKRTERGFLRWGSATLLVAKFIPGLSTAAPPLAGSAGMGSLLFLAWDFLGTLLWCSVFTGIGFLFRHQAQAVLDEVSRYGTPVMVVAVAALGAYIGRKYVERRRVMRLLKVARISAGELHERILGGDPLAVIDMRNPAEIAATGSVPGAIRMRGGELELRHGEVARDRDVILYCS